MAPDPIDKVMTHQGKKWRYCCQENSGMCNGKWRVKCKGAGAPRKKEKDKQGGQGNAGEDAGEGGSPEDTNNVKRLKIMQVLTEAMQGVDFDQ
jgi:hypothetical protein